MKDIYHAISEQAETFDSTSKKMALREAIKRLPEDQQKVLQLYYALQLPIKVIAVQMHYSVTTIYTKLYRALYTLKKQFNPKEFEKANQILYGEFPNWISY